MAADNYSGCDLGRDIVIDIEEEGADEWLDPSRRTLYEQEALSSGVEVVDVDEAAARMQQDAASSAGPCVLIIEAFEVNHPVVQEICMAPEKRRVGLVILCDDNDLIPGYVDKAATASISRGASGYRYLRS